MRHDDVLEWERGAEPRGAARSVGRAKRSSGRPPRRSGVWPPRAPGSSVRSADGGRPVIADRTRWAGTNPSRAW